VQEEAERTRRRRRDRAARVEDDPFVLLPGTEDLEIDAADLRLCSVVDACRDGDHDDARGGSRLGRDRGGNAVDRGRGTGDADDGLASTKSVHDALFEFAFLQPRVVYDERLPYDDAVPYEMRDILSSIVRADFFAVTTDPDALVRPEDDGQPTVRDRHRRPRPGRQPETARSSRRAFQGGYADVCLGFDGPRPAIPPTPIRAARVRLACGSPSRPRRASAQYKRALVVACRSSRLRRRRASRGPATSSLGPEAAMSRRTPPWSPAIQNLPGSSDPSSLCMSFFLLFGKVR